MEMIQQRCCCTRKEALRVRNEARADKRGPRYVVSTKIPECDATIDDFEVFAVADLPQNLRALLGSYDVFDTDLCEIVQLAEVEE